MKLAKAVVLALFLSLVTFQVGFAAEPRNLFRVSGTWSITDGERISSMKSYEFKSGGGLGLTYERRINKLIGVGFSWLYTNYDVEFPVISDEGRSRFRPLLGELNFCVTRKEKVDIFVGPTLGYAWWSDLSLRGGAEVSVKDQLVYGANAGLDVHLSDAWGLSFGVRYLVAKAEIEGLGEVDVDPWVFSIGGQYRF